MPIDTIQACIHTMIVYRESYELCQIVSYYADRQLTIHKQYIMQKTALNYIILLCIVELIWNMT